MPPESLSTRVSRRSTRFATSSARSIAAWRSWRCIRYRWAKTSRFCSTVSVDVEVVELGRHAEPRARLLRLARQPVAEHLELALVGDRLRREQPHRRRLARAVRAEQADARAGGHVEVEPVDGGDRPVALDDAAQADRGGFRGHAGQHRSRVARPGQSRRAATAAARRRRTDADVSQPRHASVMLWP